MAEYGTPDTAHVALVEALCALERTWEIIYCDDGSQDGSFDILRARTVC